MNRITYNERSAVYKAALAAWGADAQVLMVLEEMAELQKEICKRYRGKDNLEAIADEIADVTIMLEQLREIFDIGELVDERMDVKIRRLRQWLEEERHG